MAGIRPFQSPHGGHELIGYAPLAPSQTYVIGDPVYIATDQLTISIKDETAILVNELVGFAAEPASGMLAGSRNTSMTIVNPAEGGGAVENSMRKFYRLQQGQLWVTNNFWDAVTGLTQDTVAGTDLYNHWQLSSGATQAEEWGLVDVDATAGTDVQARIVMILDASGRPFTADTAETTAGTTATQIVFEIANISELGQVGIGVNA
ncbi:hypothetical protein LCGC14_2059100 [marine sediment metagenome]|uniref:Uncharacterized protein n=1 Tax=marine sediment metagenome TaxID=412755 RepID=A0A0F9ELU1_9ZZZZ